MGQHGNIFAQAAYDTRPLAGREAVPIPSAVTGRSFVSEVEQNSGGSLSRFAGHDVALNMRGILASGAMTIYYVPQDKGGWKPLSHQFNLQADDSYARSVNEIMHRAQNRLQSNPDILTLLHKHSWGKEDRVVWERALSQTVSEEMDKVPGLDTYRTTNDIQKLNLNLNDLSADIDARTSKIEFDCDIMSMTEGAVIQRIEDSLLPPSAPEGDLKRAAPYFAVASQAMTIAGDPKKTSRDPNTIYHAYLMSSVTGNVIEATADPSHGQHAYMESIDPNFSFEKFAYGQPFIGKGLSGVENGFFVNREQDRVYLGSEIAFSVAREETERAIEMMRELRKVPGMETMEQAVEAARLTKLDLNTHTMIGNFVNAGAAFDGVRNTRGASDAAFGAWNLAFQSLAHNPDPELARTMVQTFKQQMDVMKAEGAMTPIRARTVNGEPLVETLGDNAAQSQQTLNDYVRSLRIPAPESGPRAEYSVHHP